ncbi:hypothetical protein AALO_G00097720 [Alosa alosa]|uniref:Uncharacterized protein n=1 Tax=Alosa alosa TaxID=278164 RepID=A0AAV6GWY6_9TELE|nr:hypothetical protein AALO_G00097720 [Alosa alosa]
MHLFYLLSQSVKTTGLSTDFFLLSLKLPTVKSFRPHERVFRVTMRAPCVFLLLYSALSGPGESQVHSGPPFGLDWDLDCEGF